MTQTVPARPTPVVDFHMHVYPAAETGRREKATYDIWEYGADPDVRFSDADGDEASAARALDASGFALGVAAHLYVPAPDERDPLAGLIESNLWVCALGRRDPRIVPFVSADPVLMAVPELIDHLEELVMVHGARGVKVHPVVQSVDVADRTSWPLFEYLEARRLPVLAHSGASHQGSMAASPDSFRPLMTAFPALRLVLAHMGGADWRQVAGFAQDHPAASFDCSEIIHWLGAPFAPNAAEFVQLLRATGVERVMLGSDFPWYDLERTLAILFSLPGLTPAEQEAIAGGNAAHFLATTT